MAGTNDFDITFNFDLNYENYLDLLKKLLNQISQLPGFVRERIEAVIKELISTVEEARTPRFMVIGRRGAGKSSLVNAIFGAKIAKIGAVEAQTGKPEWYSYERDGKKN